MENQTSNSAVPCFSLVVKILPSATTHYAETQNAEYNLRMWLPHTPLFGGVKFHSSGQMRKTVRMK